MKKVNIISVFIGLLIVASPFFAHAAGGYQCNSSEEKTIFLLINGMNNDKDEVKASFGEMMTLVEEAVASYVKAGDKISFSYLINHNENKITQLHQVWKQRGAVERKHLYRWLSGRSGRPDWVDDELAEELLSQPLAEAIHDIDYTDPDLKSMVIRCKELLKAGYRVVLIAHSQGNMYATQIYDRIAEDDEYSQYSKSICVVGVASPDIEVGNGFSYSTEEERSRIENRLYSTGHEDVIMNLVRKYYTSTLDSNVYLEKYSDDRLNHSFVEAYLESPLTRSKISESIVYAFQNLTYPNSNEAVTIILDKRGNPFLSLGVFVGWSNEDANQMFVGPSDSLFYQFGYEKGPGELTITRDFEIYTLRCQDLPKGPLIINGGIWNRTDYSDDAYVTVTTGDGQSISEYVWVDPSWGQETYEGSHGVIISYDDTDGTYRFTH
ncbi:MAG: hypothetical protein GY793_00500 [Proteobacteria bacterium]|nr:hypothetical protein [Pseudomonadota bacterium]